jgi:hypothetical protein
MKLTVYMVKDALKTNPTNTDSVGEALIDSIEYIRHKLEAAKSACKDPIRITKIYAKRIKDNPDAMIGEIDDWIHHRDYPECLVKQRKMDQSFQILRMDMATIMVARLRMEKDMEAALNYTDELNAQISNLRCCGRL